MSSLGKQSPSPEDMIQIQKNQKQTGSNDFGNLNLYIHLVFEPMKKVSDHKCTNNTSMMSWLSYHNLN